MRAAGPTDGGPRERPEIPALLRTVYLQELNMTWRTLLTARTTSGSLFKLGSLTALGLGVALVAGACTVTSGTDGDPGGGNPTGGNGMGGEDPGTGGSTGGTNTGGTDTGGSGGTDTGGTGGTGGTTEPTFDCHDGGEVEGTLASTEPSDDDDECWACIKETCADEFAECHAVEPHSVCGWDEPDTYGGEIECMFECFDAKVADMAFLGDEVDVDDCAAQCAADECSTGEATSVTSDLAYCAVQAQDENEFGCQAECGWLE